MSERQEQIAQKVVELFKSALNEKAREHISDAEFKALYTMIREAMSAEAAHAAELVERTARQLRAESGREEMEL